MTVTKEELEYYAGTMLDQLTYGHRGTLKAMLGTQNIIRFEFEYQGYKQPAIAFDFKMSRKYKYCRIIYQQGKDVYAMQFLDKNGKVVTEFEEVYFDELNPKFSEVTGLCLIMPRIVNW